MTDPFDTVRAAFRLPPEGHHRLCNSRLNPVGPESQCDCFMRRYQPALAALAEIEERLREAERHLGDATDANCDLHEHLKKAEAERDELKRTLATYSEEDSWADLEAARARITQLEERIDELEAVVRGAADLLEGA